ncbi:MAG: hypothetical protein ACKO5K_07425 [Armatimonadota bacterium]
MANPQPRKLGMYIHQHWPYHHPYCARTWSRDDWRGYADGLTRLGYNTVLLWPMAETIPDPPTPSDVAHLEKMRDVIAMLQSDFRMTVYVVLCPNVAPIDEEARKATYELRHFFYSDRRVDPGDPVAMDALIDRRAKLMPYLSGADGFAIIDSDPGGYPGSTNQEFVDLMVRHRALFDRFRPGIELIYWMHAGWLGYNRFYQTGVLEFSTPEENQDCLRRLADAAPEPWSIANGLEAARAVGLEHKVMSYNYGRIEGEPSYPRTNWTGPYAYEGGGAPGPLGVMGNAQTHCVQLPNTFAFAQGARGGAIDDDAFLGFAEDLLPGLGDVVLAGWKAMGCDDPERQRAAADAVAAVPGDAVVPGVLAGLLFGDGHRFLGDLVLQLRQEAAYNDLRRCEGTPSPALVRAFAEAAGAWQAAHGYENSWWLPDIDATLRKIGHPAVDAMLAEIWNPFALPEGGIDCSGYEYVANVLRTAESFTPRLLAALREAGRE